jgi:hypothetical protein
MPNCLFVRVCTRLLTVAVQHRQAALCQLRSHAANSCRPRGTVKAATRDDQGAVGPHADRKMFTLQTLPDCNELFFDHVGKVAGFSLHAAVVASAQREIRRPEPARLRNTNGVARRSGPVL